MKFYEIYQRLDYGYMRAPDGVKIYLRASVTVYLPGGVTLMSVASGNNPKWTFDFYLTTVSNSTVPTPYEKIEMIFLKQINPTSTDPASLEKAVRTEVTNLLKLGVGTYTVVSNIYNDKKVLEGQVTNTIASDGQIIAI